MDDRAAAAWKSECACFAAAEVSRGCSDPVGDRDGRAGDGRDDNADRRGAGYWRHSGAGEGTNRSGRYGGHAGAAVGGAWSGADGGDSAEVGAWRDCAAEAGRYARDTGSDTEEGRWA